MRELEEVALAFHRACQEADVAYAFMGGLAVMAWGQPRATVDIDALLSYQPEDIQAFGEALKGQALDLEERGMHLALKDGSHVTIFDDLSPFHIDVKPALEPLEQEEIQSAHEVTLADSNLRFAPPEHAIAFKLSFGTSRDIEDARSMLARQGPHLDLALLDRLAERLNVEGPLAEIEEQIDQAMDDSTGEA